MTPTLNAPTPGETTTDAAVVDGASRPFHPRYTWKWTESNSNGYRFAGALSIGRPTHLERAPLLPGFASLDDVSTCDFNEQTDAVIPLELSMRNETTGFSSDVSSSFLGGLTAYYVQGSAAPTPLTVITDYSSGEQCTDLPDDQDSSGWSVSWSNVSPDSSVGPSYSYVLLRGYFTPAEPDGNPTLLANAMLVLSTTFQVQSFTGPPGSVLPPLQIGSPPTPVPVIPLSGTQYCRVDEADSGPEVVCG